MYKKFLTAVGIIIISLFIVIFLYGLYNYIRIGHFFIIKKKFLNRFTLYIPNVFWEPEEQYYLSKYLNEDDIVLQLGANVGTSCILVDKIVNKKDKQIAVEPNKDIIDILLYNKERTKSEFQIVDAVITDKDNMYLDKTNSDDIAFTTTDKVTEHKVKNCKLSSLNKFNVLFADCEGCLEPFLKEYEYILTQINKIIYEKDMPHICNYNYIERLLKKNNFVNKVDGFVCVWIKE
jgi:FkbM family methyltransferase